MAHKDHCLRCGGNPCTCAIVEYMYTEKQQEQQDNQVKGCGGDCDECDDKC